MPRKRGREDGGASGRSRARSPRKQNQPRGTAKRRRRHIARRRTIKQRLAEKRTLYPKGCRGPRASFASYVRDVFKRRPVHPRELGFANRELQPFEHAIWDDGALGVALTLSATLQCFAHMFPDLSTLLEVIAIDLVERTSLRPLTLSRRLMRMYRPTWRPLKWK